MIDNFLVFHYTSDYEKESVLEIILIDMNPNEFIFKKNSRDKFTITPICNLYTEDAISMMLKGLIPCEIDHIIAYIEKCKEVELPERYNTYIITTYFKDANFLFKENVMHDYSIAN
jgi:hypothetical protein